MSGAHFRSAHHGVGDGLLQSFDDFTGEVMQLSPAGKRVIGLSLVASIKEELSTPGRGKYRKGETKRLGKGGRRKDGTVKTRGAGRVKLGSRASAPGDPPAPDSGALRNSVLYHEQNGKDVVGVDQPQAAALEFGTKTAGRDHNVVILPRPFMRPGFEKVRDKLGPDVAVALKTKPRE
jgi:phage gpG-like protein